MLSLELLTKCVAVVQFFLVRYGYPINCVIHLINGNIQTVLFTELLIENIQIQVRKHVDLLWNYSWPNLTNNATVNYSTRMFEKDYVAKQNNQR